MEEAVSVTLFRSCREERGRVLTGLTRCKVGSVRRTTRMAGTTNLSICGVIRKVRPVYFRGTG